MYLDYLDSSATNAADLAFWSSFFWALYAGTQRDWWEYQKSFVNIGNSSFYFLRYWFPNCPCKHAIKKERNSNDNKIQSSKIIISYKFQVNRNHSTIILPRLRDYKNKINNITNELELNNKIPFLFSSEWMTQVWLNSKDLRLSSFTWLGSGKFDHRR